MKLARDTRTLPFLPFALPDIGEAEIEEVVESLRSGWITSGPKVRRFEEIFAGMIGPDVTAVAVNSATAGLHLALEAIGLGPGDEVVVPVHTFTATAEVVRYLGADPVFVDVDPITLNIDVVAVEAAIGPRTRAIIPVHYGGLACDMAALITLAARHGLAIIEDAAHALPTTAAGRPIGSLATTATVFSFYATKTLATGEGGMLVTRDPAIAARARTMRLHGISRDVFDRYQAGGSWYYEVVAPGFKYNMTDLAAALGLHQASRLSAMHQRRTAIAEAYHHVFAPLPLTLPARAPEGDTHAWHLYPIRTGASPATRDGLIDYLAACNIGTSVHYVPLHLHPYWRDRYRLRPEQFPVSTEAYRTLVSLPIYSKMDDAAVERVIAAVSGYFGGSDA